VRRAKSKPILDDIRAYLEREQSQVLPKSPEGQAIAYTLSNWKALVRYCEDGDLEIDNNGAERSLRGIAVGRKNWMFFGSNNGGWHTAQAQFSAVIHLPVGSPPSVCIAAERTASRTIMGSNGGLAGLGPKQARNFWQCLGVTQFEIPLDSRICAWINALPSSFRVSPNRLYNSLPYYEATMAHIQAICEKAEVLPCEFDAAVFASADSDEWPEEDEVF